MAQRTSSPIDESDFFNDQPVYETPVIKQRKPRVKKNDYQKVASSAKYPEIKDYIDSRVAFYQRYLPSGSPITDLKPEEMAAAWVNAVTIIAELEALGATIQESTKVEVPIAELDI